MNGKRKIRITTLVRNNGNKKTNIRQLILRSGFRGGKMSDGGMSGEYVRGNMPGSGCSELL